MAAKGTNSSSGRCSPSLENGSSNGWGSGLAVDESDARETDCPEPGWSVQALHKNEAAGEAGMWSLANERGTRLQGWLEGMEILSDFAQLPIICPECEQGMRVGSTGMQERSNCSNPTVVAALARGISMEECQLLFCRHRSPEVCFFALEVLASLAQEEEWTLRSGNGQAGEYLGCLKYYLNRQFGRLVEQGKVVQCFDIHGQAHWAAFSTGLLMRGTEEAIFGVLQRRAQPATGFAQWELHSFVPLRQLQDPGQPWNQFEALVSPPEPATFVEDPMELLYVGSTAADALQLHPQLWDDLETHLDSFPAALLEPGVTAQGRKQVAIAAVQRALKTLANNPFAAAPMAHTNGLIQLLLPLKLDSESSQAQLALMIVASKSRRGARMHRATRVLSLSQAYMQARVLMPVQQPWLAIVARAPASKQNSLLAAQKGASTDSGLSSSSAFQEVLEAQLATATTRGPVSSESPIAHERFTFDVPAEGNNGHFMHGTAPTYGGPSRPPNGLQGSPAVTCANSGAAASSQSVYSNTAPGLRPAVRTPPVPGHSSRPGSGLTAYSPPGSYPDAPSYSTTSSFSDGSGSDRGLPNNLPGTLAPGGGSGSYIIQESSRMLSESPRLRHSSSLPASLSPSMRRSYGDLYRETGRGGLQPGEQQLGGRGAGNGQNSGFEDVGPASRNLGRFESLPPLMLDELPMPVEVLQLSPIPNGSLESGKPPLSGNLGGYSWGTSSGSVSNALLASSSDGSYGGGGPSTAEYGVRSLGGGGGSPLGGPDSPQLYRSEAGSTLWARELNRELGPGSIADLEYQTGASRRPPEEEYVEFTPIDDLCPKLNISQLPPRFVMDFLAGERPAGEAAAEQHAEQCFSRFGVVARTLVRENKNHSGKWFAIIEFAYWTDDVVRLRLVAGEQIRFTSFYAGEDVFIRRHKDKQKVVNRTQTAGMTGLPSGGLPCRPDWKYTGTDTRAGKPLYKGPCTVCGRESTVPFKPVVNGQPPRCRNCLPLTQGGLLPPGSQQMAQLAAAIPSSMAAGGLQPNHQSSMFLESGLGMGPLSAYQLHHLHD